MNKKSDINVLSLLLVLFIGANTFFIVRSKRTKAQNWTALPPYNTLWPLWSPALSPISASTGLPEPLVTSLSPNTILPVQPGLTWDPVLRYPWLLYNTPMGLAYYDPAVGIDLWPPRILVNQITGLPIVLTLPAGYADLPPTTASWLASNVPAANWAYMTAYPNYSSAAPAFPQPTIVSLMTPTALI
ncbi:MAG: hypothetical protein AB1847_08375 [bacterium]